MKASNKTIAQRASQMAVDNLTQNLYALKNVRNASKDLNISSTDLANLEAAIKTIQKSLNK